MAVTHLRGCLSKERTTAKQIVYRQELCIPFGGPMELAVMFAASAIGLQGVAAHAAACWMRRSSSAACWVVNSPASQRCISCTRRSCALATRCSAGGRLEQKASK